MNSELLPKSLVRKLSLQIETLATLARARGRGAGRQRTTSVGCPPPKAVSETSD